MKKIVFAFGLLLLISMFARAEDISTWDDWTMRTELALKAEDNNKPFYFIETVQPLYRAFDRQNTFLLQMRAAGTERYTERREDFNMGLGYRKLFSDNAAMAGIRLFYDVESKYNLSRWSVGADLSWKIFDLYANQYFGLKDWTKTNDGGSEKSQNGHDVDLAVQLPFMPWAKAHVIYYQWNNELGTENLIGKKLSLEGALTLHWSIEFGKNTDNLLLDNNFMVLRYRWSEPVREYQSASNNFFSSSAFEIRDMRDYTLEHMRRSNTVESERVGP